jgi:hypothetical protein
MAGAATARLRAINVELGLRVGTARRPLRLLASAAICSTSALLIAFEPRSA